MNEYELIKWLKGLEVQTLTDELRETIIENVSDTIDFYRNH